MLFEENYLDLSGDLLSEMRLLVEGAVTLLEDDTPPLMRLARDHNEPETFCAERHRRCAVRHALSYQAAASGMP